MSLAIQHLVKKFKFLEETSVMEVRNRTQITFSHKQFLKVATSDLLGAKKFVIKTGESLDFLANEKIVKDHVCIIIKRAISFLKKLDRCRTFKTQIRPGLSVQRRTD